MSFPECAHTAQCAPYKHHYDECVERVTRQEEDEDFKGPKEDCVEECKFLTIMKCSVDLNTTMNSWSVFIRIPGD